MSILPYETKKDCKEILEINKWLKEFSEEKGVVFVDLYPYFVDGKGNINKDLFRDEIHPNKQGNELIAKLICKQGFNNPTCNGIKLPQLKTKTTSIFKKIINWFN